MQPKPRQEQMKSRGPDTIGVSEASCLRCTGNAFGEGV